MPKQRSFFLVLAAFLAFLVFQHPTEAKAATPDWQNTDCTSLNTALQSAQMSRAQFRATTTNNFYAYMPPIDLATYNCLGKLDTFLGQLQAISTLGIGAVINQIIATAIVGLIGQVCNEVMGTITGIENLLYSQLNRFCLPLPNLNLNLKVPTFPAGPPCVGTPLLKLVPMPANTNGGATLWSIWGIKPGQNSTQPVTP